MEQDNAAPAAVSATPLAAEGVKPWWLSKTIIGAGIGAAGMATAYAGVQLDADTQKLLIDQAYAFAAAALRLSRRERVEY